MSCPTTKHISNHRGFIDRRSEKQAHHRGCEKGNYRRTDSHHPYQLDLPCENPDGIVTADRTQLKALVLKGSGRTYDSLPSNYRFEDIAFSKLRSVHYKRLQRSFEDSEFTSWGIIDENGKLTNAGALLADESPIRQSRIFCTRWNGLDMTSGLGEAIDDVELEGCVIGQLQDAVSFVRNNSRKKWWKEKDYRENCPVKKGKDLQDRAIWMFCV